MPEEQLHLYPDAQNFDELPEQTAYKVNIDEASYFDLDTLNSYPLIWTNEIHAFMLEGEPGTQIDWHTHMPDMDQINFVIQGKAVYTLEQEDGEQVIELEEGEVVYLPGGARHKVEHVGDETVKQVTVYKAVSVPRSEMLDGKEYENYDTDEFPVNLWIDRLRDEIVMKNDESVST